MKIPGITLCVGEEGIRHPDFTQNQPYLKQEKMSAARWTLSVIHHQVFYHSALIQDCQSDVGIAIDGYILPPEDSENNDVLSHCLELYFSEGIDFVKRLNGAFNLVVWDKRKETVHLATDRYGVRPLCHGRFGGVDYIAVSADDILTLSQQPAKLNMHSFYNLLSYSPIRAGWDTLFKGIRVIPPASILTWRNGYLSEQEYWKYHFDPVSEVTEDFVDQAAEVFRQAVRRHLAGFNGVGLSLSGGLDSRAVAAAISPSDRDRFNAFTFGYADFSSEVELARQTANLCELNWRYISLEPEDFIKNASQGIRLTEGRDQAVQSYSLKVFQEVSSFCNLSITGLSTEILASGRFTYIIMDAIESQLKEPLDVLLKSFYYFQSFADKMFIDPSSAFSYIADIEGQFREDLRCANINEITNLADRFAMRQRHGRVMYPRQQWQHFYLESLTPTLDNDLIDIFLRIPAHERAHYRFFRRLLHSLNPQCMEIPYQRTMLPPSIPSKYWPEAARIESEREELLRRIYCDTGGKVYIPYHRYYSNFDEWMRVNSNWKTFIKTLLLSKDCRLTAEFINSDWLKQLLEEQMSGKHAHYQQINILLTAELILRELF